MSEELPHTGHTDAGGPLCAICQTPVGPGDDRVECPACHAGYHRDCWQENGGCAVYGCSEVPAIEAREKLDIPISYWGREHKPCPACGAQIVAAAVRCRHCGATFASARPLEADEHRAHVALKQQQPELAGKIPWLFGFCVLPCTAPIASVVGLIWWLKNRAAIKSLPSLYHALCVIGLCVGWGQTLILIFFGLTYSATRAH